MDKIIRYFFDLNITQLIFLSLFKKKLNLYPFKNMHTVIRQSAEISGAGALILGRRWRLERFKASQFIMDKESKLQLNGDFAIYTGCDIRIHPKAKLILGSGYINKNANISCYNHISLGSNVIISENVVIRDSDSHHINGKLKAEPIKIEDDVWIGMNVTILSGVTIGKGCVIAAGSVVIQDIPANCLAAGCPAIIKKENISWY